MAKKLLKWVAVLAAIAAVALLGCWYFMAYCPHKEGAPGPRDRELESRLLLHVRELAGRIGQRNIEHPAALEGGRQYIVTALHKLGLNPVSYGYKVKEVVCNSVEANVAGREKLADVVVVGAHYDSVPGAPGADDNASGVAALLEMARELVKNPARRDVRFVAFPNEEDPYFGTREMGSDVYARMSRERGDRIRAMIALDSLGYYSSEPASQKYPTMLALFLPEKGDFLSVVGNVESRPLVHRFHAYLAPVAGVPSLCAAAPQILEGIDWSDHQSFWKAGYPAVMVTDTAVYRNPFYHTAGDTPETLDYERLARVTSGLAKAVSRLADE